MDMINQKNNMKEINQFLPLISPSLLSFADCMDYVFEYCAT